jgi:hypothetical protein
MYAELRGAQHAFDIFASPRTARMLDGTLRFLTAMYERAKNADAPRPTEQFAPLGYAERVAVDNP